MFLGEFQQPAKSEIGTPKKQNASSKEKADPLSDWGMLIFTGVIAFASLGRWYIYWRQKQLMSKQAEHTEKAANASVSSAETAKRALEIAQRPSVLIGSITLKDVAPTNLGQTRIDCLSKSYIEISIVNQGPTEAYKFYFYLLPRIVGVDNPSPVVSPPTDLQRGKGEREQTARLGDIFQQREIASAGVGKAELRLDGFIRYADMFDRGWYIRFESAMRNERFRITMQVWEDGKQPPEDWP